MGKGSEIEISFTIPTTPEGTLLGFGGWFRASAGVGAEISGFDQPYVLTDPADPDWSKFGSQWYSDGSASTDIRLSLSAEAPGFAALYSPETGVVSHPYLDEAEGDPRNLMRNKHQIAPEANFFAPEPAGVVSDVVTSGDVEQLQMAWEIHLKSCNRCARFLPINVQNERLHLSFSNHCVAAHRVPCSHPLFSQLRNIENDELVSLHNGYQLECRFCKKFEVNAALNPLRTADQMKEDGARRRAVELLLSGLYEGSRSLLYRDKTGRELATEIWESFGRACFKCGTPLAEPRDMHLDHTRPLALLWPLDGTATALCATHNSEKRDRPPVDYYSEAELERLAEITGIALDELRDPSPNLDAIRRLGKRMDWLFDEFLLSDDLQGEHDGKVPADLLVKALQKAINAAPAAVRFDLERRYRDHRSS